MLCSHLYQIAHLGDEDDEPEFSSRMQLEEGETFFFAPRGLTNLAVVDQMDSLSPLISSYVSSEVFLDGLVAISNDFLHFLLDKINDMMEFP